VGLERGAFQSTGVHSSPPRSTANGSQLAPRKARGPAEPLMEGLVAQHRAATRDQFERVAAEVFPSSAFRSLRQSGKRSAAPGTDGPSGPPASTAVHDGS
jgi:hypothetical protein